jgi:pimeloyl-[acyl-carrier protein] methyl ester esterase
MDGTGDLFSEFIACLPAGFDVAVVRYPATCPFPYAELEHLVRESCPQSEPFVLIAESFSTPLALQYAATNPANLRGIVLCAGFATSPVRGWRRLLASLLASFMFRIPLPGCAAKRWLVGAHASPSLLASVSAAISSVKAEVLSARLRAVLGCDVRKAVSQIRASILYIRAGQDRLVGSGSMEELRQIRPQMEVTVIEGPHLLLQREPQRAAEVAARFIRSALLAEEP